MKIRVKTRRTKICKKCGQIVAQIKRGKFSIDRKKFFMGDIWMYNGCNCVK